MPASGKTAPRCAARSATSNAAPSCRPSTTPPATAAQPRARSASIARPCAASSRSTTSRTRTELSSRSGPEPLGSSHVLVAHALALLLLAVMALLADCGAAFDGPAFDEPLHLGAGLAHLSTGDFRLDEGTGVLPQMWAALPLWRSGVSLDADASAWSEADVWGL